MSTKYKHKQNKFFSGISMLMRAALFFFGFYRFVEEFLYCLKTDILLAGKNFLQLMFLLGLTLFFAGTSWFFLLGYAGVWLVTVKLWQIKSVLLLMLLLNFFLACSCMIFIRYKKNNFIFHLSRSFQLEKNYLKKIYQFFCRNNNI